jgi:hypothetical protein
MAPVKKPKQKGIWIQRDGTPIAVVDMKETHIQYTIAMLRRRVAKEEIELKKAMVGFEPVTNTIPRFMASINMLLAELGRRGFEERQMNDWTAFIELELRGPGYERIA